MVEPHSQRSVGRSIRPVLLAGLGTLLALLVGLGVYAARALDRLSSSEKADVRTYLSRTERLQAVENLLTSASNAVRDYLLDTNALAVPGYREEARSSWSKAIAGIREYRGIAADRRELTDKLERQVSSYWALGDAALRLDGGRRLAGGSSLFFERLIPMREEFLATIKELAARDHSQLVSAAGNAEEFAHVERNWLWIAIGTAGLLSLSVALLTFRHLTKLEGVAETHYIRAVNAAMELEQLSERLLNSQEEERRRIAMDLHDDFGQRMASLIFELSSATERSDASPALRQTMHAMGERLGNLAKDLQQMSRGLHSAVLDKIGLEAAVRSDCAALSKLSPLSVNFHATGVPRGLPDNIALAMYRIFQEATQNVLKHAQTERLDVALEAEGSKLVLRVQDFGRGFEAKSSGERGSLGLVSMRERLRAVGGAFMIDSAPGRGAEVKATVPLP